MKKPLQLLIVLLLVPMLFHAQKALTGLWTGKLSNDSNTVRKDQAFEIALTQYREKVYGYSRSAFIVHDTLFYILKRVKGTINGDVCEIRDDEIISSNFPGRLDKGVHVTTIFRLNKQDTTWHLDGEWKTNKTKNFFAVTGKIELKEETNLDNSRIFPHLEELNVAKNVPFYAATKNPAPEKKAVVDAPVVKQDRKQKKRDDALALKNKPTGELNPDPARTIDPVSPKTIIPEETKTATNRKKETANKKIEDAAIAPAISPATTPKLPVTPEVKVAIPAEHIAERVTLAPQVINISNDSLELALYDNGEVDGDTVSVTLNGELLLARQGLKTTAIKKTIHLPPGVNEVTLVLYAENLGKYPPNTGLLVVHDGDETYQLRFSADLQQNASVIFRKKPR